MFDLPSRVSRSSMSTPEVGSKTGKLVVDFSYKEIGAPTRAHPKALCPRARSACFRFKAVD